jgi:DtxR family Mn-dependent transcriptional regulator
VASLTVENYVKAIFKICLDQNGQPASTGQVATAQEVSPGTVTSMLKTLSEQGLAAYTPYEGVRLSPAGDALALKILRRHRLIERFLAEVLEMGWDEVHEEAEQMEHVVSDKLIDRIDDYLGHPTHDPHGDPIPGADGSLATSAGPTLAQCRAGCRFRLVRVLDQGGDFLRYLGESGLALGAQGTVLANRGEAGIIAVEIGRRHATLGLEAAEKLLVVIECPPPRDRARSARDEAIGAKVSGPV